MKPIDLQLVLIETQELNQAKKTYLNLYLEFDQKQEKKF
jgi:hypothetical protein